MILATYAICTFVISAIDFTMKYYSGVKISNIYANSTHLTLIYFIQTEKHSPRRWYSLQKQIPRFTLLMNQLCQSFPEHNIMTCDMRQDNFLCQYEPYINHRTSFSCDHTWNNERCFAALIYSCINHGDQRVWSIWNYHKCLSVSAWFEYLCYGFTAILFFLILEVRGSSLYYVRIWRLQTSGSGI